MVDDDDSDVTPVATPDARRRRSSQGTPAVRKCPACKGDQRVDCALCFNTLIGSCTRYVPEDKAMQWELENRDTDPPTE